MFTGAELQNTEVECSRATNAEIGLINLGTKEENINLEIMNDELGLYINQEITLSEEPFDKENRFSGLMPVAISENAKAGEYPISVRAVYNNGNSEEKKTLNLIIKDCEKAVFEEKTTELVEEKKEIIQEEPLEKVTAQVVYQQEEKDPIVLIAGIGVAVGILAIIVVIVLLLKKK